MYQIRIWITALGTVSFAWVLASVGATRPAEHEADLRAQAEAVQTAEKTGLAKPEAVGPLSKALEAEGDLFAGPTHGKLWLLGSLCRAHIANKDYPAAERASAAAVVVQEHFFGPHPTGEGPKKDRDTAEIVRRFRLAVDVRQATFGERHPLVAFTLIDLGLAYEADGQLDQARKTLEQATFQGTGTLVSAFASDAGYHLDRLRLANPAGAAMTAAEESRIQKLEQAERSAAEADRFVANGDRDAARAEWKRTLPVGASYHADGVAESAQLEFARRWRSLVERFIAFAARSGLPDSEASAAYAALVYHKGGVFTAQHRYRIERQHPIMKPVFDAHENLTQQLAYLARAVPSDDRKVRSRLVRKAALEAEMSRRYEVMPKQLHAPPAQYLPVASALIDYYTYGSVSPDGKDERGLVCFVSRPVATHRGKEVVFRDLGRLELVAKAVTRWREDILSPGGAGSEAAAEVRKRVWEPLLPLLDGATTVLICPDAVLSVAPFAALPGAKPRTYLTEEIKLVLAPTPQLIQQLPSRTEALAKRGDFRGLVVPRSERIASPFLVGGVDFGSRSEPPRSRSELTFKSLPGTTKEVTAIGALFREVLPDQKPVVLTGSTATETSVRKAVGRHRWVHLATHGYFAPAPKGDLDLPELRAGVVLAGVNAGGIGADDDGILTALEVASLDLAHVELAVLSACETGLGKTQEGEGVLGLQRAFQVAGARTTITSLWSVDDEATRALMERFYSNLWVKKMTRAEALRETQSWMLREGKQHEGIARGLRKVGAPKPTDDGRLPPYYWAAFVLSGDWR